MSHATASGVSARAVREFGLALRSGPFRVAFVLSLIVHLVLIVVLGRGVAERASGFERRIPLMRVRLLPPGISPAALPAVPASMPAIPRPKPIASGRPAADLSLQRPAPSLPLPEAQAPPVVPERALAPATEMTAREGPSGQQTPAAEVTAAVAASPQTAPVPAGAQGTDAGVPLPEPPVSQSGSGGQAVAGLEREGQEAVGPAPRDLATVRRRIDAHKVYPQIAVRNGWQGRVLVEMRLEGDGSLTAVRLLEGSGYPVLDDATITAVRRASPFPPITRVLTVPVEYRLIP